MSDSILWRRLDVPGHEVSRLRSLDAGWLVSGVAVFSFEGEPSSLQYRIFCDTDWWTMSARVVGWIGVQDVDISVAVDRDRRWRMNGAECPAVEGCLDIDLGFSPSTNLLPIRRLSLGIGDSAEVCAAWLPLPSLDFEPLTQTYRRDGDTAYHYESAGGAFVRALEVNESGFVTDYPGLWTNEL